jgi:DNA-binding CsgD family transcriptional regulator
VGGVRGDYHVKVKVRNGRIIGRMREVGIPSLAELSRRSGVTQQVIGKIVGMKELPRRQNGEWRDAVMSISSALHCEPETLFNEQQSTTPLRQNGGETFMDIEQVTTLMGGSDTLEAVENRQTASRFLAILNPRERAVVEAHMHGATYDEIGDELGVTRERIRQIEAKAIRKMIGTAKPKWGTNLQAPR